MKIIFADFVTCDRVTAKRRFFGSILLLFFAILPGAAFGTSYVGIGGVASPSRPLHVYGTGGTASLSSSSGEIVYFDNSVSQGLALGAMAAGPYSMWLQTKRVTNDGSSWPLSLNPLGGNVGIGTLAPTAAFQVNNPAAGNSVTFGADYGAATNLGSFQFLNFGDGNNYFDTKTKTAGYTYFRTGQGTETSYARNWMVVNASNGYVGIGTLPLSNARFSVYAADNVPMSIGPNSWGRVLNLGGWNPAAEASVMASDGNLHIDSMNTGGHVLYLNYFTSGAIDIGAGGGATTIHNRVSVPNGADISANVDNWAVTVYQGAASTNAHGMYVRANNDNNISFGVLNQAANAWAHLLYGSGTLSSSGTHYAFVFSPTSDERLKKNIETFSNGLSVVKALRGVSFDWRKDGSHSSGVIAQEVQKILPFAVSEIPSNTGDHFLSVNYNALLGPMIEAVKSIDQRIESQEELVAQLESENKALRNEFKKYAMAKDHELTSLREAFCEATPRAMFCQHAVAPSSR